MALEPITRQEKIIAGQDLTPITRMEMFLKQYGGGGGGSVPTGGVTTLHINITDINRETMEATFTADKTPTEMQEASVTGPIWCVVTIAAGLMAENAVSIGVPPAWYGGQAAFGSVTANVHNDNGNNKTGYIVRRSGPNSWLVDLTQIGG